MWKYAKSIFLFRILTMIITASLAPINVIVFQKLIDGIIKYISDQQLTFALIITGVVFGGSLFFQSIIDGINGLQDISCDKKLTTNFEPIIIKKFKNLIYSCYESKETQNTIQRVSSQPYLRIKTVFFQSLSMIGQFLSIVGLIIIFLDVSIWLIVALLVFFVPMLWVNYKSSSLWWFLYEEQSEEEREFGYLNGLMSMKASLFELNVYQAIDYIEKLCKSKSEHMLKQKIRVLRKTQALLYIKSLLAAAWYATAILVLVNSLFGAAISIGLFVSLINVALSMVSSITDFTGSFGSLSRQIMDMKFYDQFLNLPEYEKPNKISAPIPDIFKIEFKNVHFKYPNTDVEILKGINFTIQSDENIAIVGANGAGKSTIIKLICKLYEPNSGQILVNGMNLQDIPYENLKHFFGVLFQEYFRYEMTIRENVGFGNMLEMNNDEKMIDAMRKSQSYEIYQTANNGLDTHLGKLEDDGVDLSGGQWQRLAIGRAYLSSASIIILDEPTASLDPIAESEMYSLFFNVMKKRGTIMISHRLASSKMAGRILVIDNGVVAESGTHDFLVSKNGIYANMYETQSSWYMKEGQ